MLAKKTRQNRYFTWMQEKGKMKEKVKNLKAKVRGQDFSEKGTKDAQTNFVCHVVLPVVSYMVEDLNA